MKIAVVTSSVPGQLDQVISETAAQLQAEGLRLNGAVKILDHEFPDGHLCDMDLRVLPDGPEVRITQSLGEGSTGCRLDPAGIAEAVAATERKDATAADLFILNKFGPQEAEGRGFCNAIAGALEHDTPVVIGVGKGNRDAFDTFVAGMAKDLPADRDAIYTWCKTMLAEAGNTGG